MIGLTSQSFLRILRMSQIPGGNAMILPYLHPLTNAYLRHILRFAVPLSNRILTRQHLQIALCSVPLILVVLTNLNALTVLYNGWNSEFADDMTSIKRTTNAVLRFFNLMIEWTCGDH
jgi:hypothetical protein